MVGVVLLVKGNTAQHAPRMPVCERLHVTVAFWGMQGWLHCILYVLFENAMGIVKLWACVAGACRPPSSLLKPTRACQGRTKG